MNRVRYGTLGLKGAVCVPKHEYAHNHLGGLVCTILLMTATTHKWWASRNTQCILRTVKIERQAHLKDNNARNVMCPGMSVAYVFTLLH